MQWNNGAIPIAMEAILIAMRLKRRFNYCNVDQ